MKFLNTNLKHSGILKMNVSKTIIKQIILSMLLSISLFNCSKDDTNDDSEPQTQNLRPIGYSINASEYSVSYNENGEVTNYSNSPSNPGVVIYNSDNKVIQCGRYSYTYNAQGRISGITEADGSTFVNQESTLVYNNEGLIATQTIRFSNASSGDSEFISRTYAYNSNNQLIYITEHNASSTLHTRDFLTYDSNENMVQRKTQRSSDGINFTDDQTLNYTYDNKKNPGYEILNNIEGTSNFSIIYLSKLTTTTFSNYAFFRLAYYSKNNVMSTQQIYSTGSTNKTYDYNYNDEDYPVSVEINRTNSDGSNTTSYKTWTYEAY